MNPFIETVAEAIHKRDCVSGCEQRATAFDKVLAGVALASLAQRRDDIARALALADGNEWLFDLSDDVLRASEVASTLLDDYRGMADAVLAALTEGS